MQEFELIDRVLFHAGRAGIRFDADRLITRAKTVTSLDPVRYERVAAALAELAEEHDDPRLWDLHDAVSLAGELVEQRQARTRAKRVHRVARRTPAPKTVTAADFERMQMAQMYGPPPSMDAIAERERNENERLETIRQQEHVERERQLEDRSKQAKGLSSLWP